MDMKSLLEKMMKFAGEPEQKAGDQVRGTEKAKKASKDHPFKGRLVGDSVEPQANMLEELSQEAQDKSIEWKLAEAWAEFKEEAFKDTAERRPARKGSRPSRGHEPVPGYKKVGEATKEQETEFHTKLDKLVHDTFGKRKDEMEESAQPREKVGRIIRRVLGDKLVWNPDYSVLYKNTRYSKTQRVDYYAMKSIKVLASRNELPELGSMLKAELEKAGYPVYKFSIGPLQISFQTRSPVQIIEPSEGINENAEELNVGDDVIITGPVEHQGETGVIDSFGQDKRFVVVNLYNHGKKSFHSSDVSFNDYADSDAEEAEMYDRDPDFRDWAARQDVDEDKVGSWVVHKDGKFLGRFATRKGAKAHAEKHGATVASSEYYNDHVKKVEEGWGAEPAAARHREQMTAVARVLQKYKNNPEQAKLASYMFQNNWSAPAIERELSGQGQYSLDWWKNRLAKAEQERGPQKDWTEYMAAEYLQNNQPDVNESRGDPHKILVNKLRDIERKPSVPSADDDARRAEQAKADYAKYVAKMRKKDPNYVPLYKMDENVPTGQTTMADKTGVNDPKQAAKVAQATQALKSATGATAPAPNIAKALDAATQGKAVDAMDMKAIEPMMDVLGAAAQDPKLANQFKTLANQARQAK